MCVFVVGRRVKLCVLSPQPLRFEFGTQPRPLCFVVITLVPPVRFDSVMQRRTLGGLGELQAKSNVLTKSSIADGPKNITCYEEQVITFKPYVGIGRITYENQLSRRDGAI